MPVDFLTVPFIEGKALGVPLQRALLDDEPHFLKECCRSRGRLPLEQDVPGRGHRGAELTRRAGGADAALGVLAVGKTI